MNDRQGALDGITRALIRIAQRIDGIFPDSSVVESFRDKSDALRLVATHDGAKVKIELSPVLRGTVFEPELRRVCKKVEDEFGYAEMAVVSMADLYAGKICAALDRQHPRDLYDVKCLLENEGLTDDIRAAFLIYLISQVRPIAELLNPVCKDIKPLYEGEFIQMAEESVSLDELESTREELIRLINTELKEEEKNFYSLLKTRAQTGT